MQAKPSTLSTLLSELLALHLEEREHMESLRHAEHQHCVARKLACANSIESLSSSLTELTPRECELALLVKSQASINADIAKRMLERTKGKIDFINRLCSPSYGSDGQMKKSTSNGGLLDLSA